MKLHQTKKNTGILLCLIFAVGIAFNGGAEQRSMTISVAPDSIPSGVSFSDMPLLVRLSSSMYGFEYSGFLEGGTDISFTDANGNALAYDIDTWNPDGESLVWVKVPTLSSGTSITMHWGSDVVAENSPTAVWSSFAGVWHCNDASAALTDATGNGLSATPAGAEGYVAQMTGVADGAVGRCRRAQDSATYYSGLRSSHIAVNSEALQVGSQFVYSGWYKANQIIGYPRLASTKTNYLDNCGWEVEFERDARRIYLRGANNKGFLADMPQCVGKWCHVAFVYDGATAYCYTNGYLAASGSIDSAMDSGLGLAIGGNANATEQGWSGWFDEVRYRAGVASADEIAVQYRMVADPGFLVYSEPARATVDVSRFSHLVAFRLNDPHVAEGVGDVPILLRLSTAIAGFRYSDFKADGNDLCITDANGGILPHEIDTWNPDGESLVWVRLPSASACAAIVAYYGSDSYVNPEVNRRATWSGYVGVWHMNESGGTAADATVYGRNGTPCGDYSQNNVGIADGVVGMARKNGGDGNSGNRSYISVPDYDSSGLTDTFTASGFFRVTSGGGWYRLFSRCTASGDEGWGQELTWNDATKLTVYGGGKAAAGKAVTIPDPVGNWVHLAFAYSGKTCTVYTNGEQVAVVDISQPATANGEPLSFGCVSDGSDWSLFGDYDELRIDRRIPSAERVRLEYMAMTATNFFSASSAIPVSTAVPDVTVSRISNAAEKGLVPGEFKIALSAPCATPRQFAYTLSGTAVAGVDYAGASMGTVVVPAGMTETILKIPLKSNPAADGDRTVIISLDGFEGLTAELTIADLRSPIKDDFRWRIRFDCPCPFLEEGETLTNFPVLVRLSSAHVGGFSYGAFRMGDGYDILFTDASGERVFAHSVDEWNEDGTSYVWVFVPELKRGTKFLMLYGSKFDLDAADVVNVPWSGYVGVWHFNEKTWRKPAHDATGHGYGAVVNAWNYPSYNDDYPDGAVGHARYNQPCSYLDGGRNWYAVPDYDAQDVGSRFTVSGWFKANGMVGHPRLLSRKMSYTDPNGWEVELPQSLTNVNVRGGSAFSIAATIPDLSEDWVHLAFVFSMNDAYGSKVAVYANGSRVSTQERKDNGETVDRDDLALVTDNALPLAFGCNAAGNEASFNGEFDEIRLCGGEVSANWVKAEYLSVRGDGFLNVSAAERIGGFAIIVR